MELRVELAGPAARPGDVTGTPATIQELVRELERESSVIEALHGALLAQRAAVAADDPQGVDASVHAIGRAMLTLQEARRQRTVLTERLAGEAIPLARLDHLPAAQGAPGLLAARDALQRAARTTLSDLMINQRILQGALDAGDAFIQHLFAAAAPLDSSYRPGLDPAAAPEPGVLLNRVG